MASTTSPKEEVEDRVSINTVRKAIKALLGWRKLHPRAAQKPASQLHQHHEFPDEKTDDGDDDFICLLLTLKKIPPKHLFRAPHKIPLPNPPLHGLTHLNLCLVVDDRPVKSPSRITAEVALKKVKSEDITIAKVLKLSKLKSDCKSFEGRRNLYSSFDMFFADARLVPLLPSVLGKQFYKKKKKVPVPLDLRGRVGWKGQIERACGSAVLCLGTGTCSVMKVGKNGMESGEIVENVVVAIKGIAEVVPKKWGGIRALHLKLSDSLALPIYDAMAEVRANVEDGIDLNGKKKGSLKDEKTKRKPEEMKSEFGSGG